MEQFGDPAQVLRVVDIEEPPPRNDQNLWMVLGEVT
jgi:hypothetical protein